MPDASSLPAAGSKADIEAAARLAARAEARQKDDKLDIGRQKGLYDTTDIRYSIHKWQATEPALPPIEAGAASDVENEDIPTARHKHDVAIVEVSPQKPYGVMPVAPERQSRRYASMAVDRDTRAAGTPKKRVVSDQHWMKDKGHSPKQDSGKTPPPARRPDAWVRPKPPPKPPKEEKEPKEPPPPLKKEDIIQYFAGAAPAYKPQHTLNANGIRRERPSPEKLEAERTQAKAKAEPKPQEPPKDPAAVLAWFAGAPKPKDHNASPKHKDTVQKFKVHDENAKAPPDRISSWLGDMPDPFTEDSAELARDARRPTSLASIGEDDDSGTEAGNRGRRERQARSRRHRSDVEDRDFVNDDEEDGRASPASGTLRRRRATRSKSRPRRNPGADYNDTDLSFTSEQALEEGHRRRVSRPQTGSSDKENQLSYNSVAKLNKTGLQRRLTTHDDLMTVLSAPTGRGRNFKSLRAKKADNATLEEVMDELRTDESKYLRELRTLVDGVIPVLLKSVLSTTSTVAAKNLFGPGTNSANATTPIVNMGIALERMKGAHKRIPLTTETALLAWVQTTHPIYVDYLKAWRMGFQDITVNLAPAENATATATPGAWDTSLQANPSQLALASGEKADVAFLLKRPLVRLKHLAKSLQAIERLQGSDLAATLVTKFQDLVAEARRRQAEELARLEDEAASSTDATRARDVNTLAPLTGVVIDPSRCVKARDLFDLKLQHSSGQRVDCRVELILRCSRPNLDSSNGDLLVCEVDSSSRWLLFPPITIGRLSARHAPNGDLIVMIRGQDASGGKCHELLSLRSVDSQAVQDWTHMLGTVPVPPEIKKINAFLEAPPTEPAPLMLTDAAVQALPSEEIQVPIGEQASVVSKNWRARPASSFFSASAIKDALGGSRSKRPDSLPPPSWAPQDSELKLSSGSRTPSPHRGRHTARMHRHSQSHQLGSPRSLNEAMLRAGTSRPGIDSNTFEPPRELAASELSTSSTPHDYNLVRKRLQGHIRYTDDHIRPHQRSSSTSNLTAWMPQDNENPMGQAGPMLSPPTPPFTTEKDVSTAMHRRTSSVPNDQMPQISRSRQASPAPGRSHHRGASEVTAHAGYFGPVEVQSLSAPVTPLEDPNELSLIETTPQPQDLVLRNSSTPYFSSSTFKPQQRRSTSPLKQQYVPSDGEGQDDSSVDGQLLSDDDDASSVSSSSSMDDLVPSLPPPLIYNKGSPRSTVPNSVYSPRSPGTIAPSQSASQAPYRQASAVFNSHGKTIAAIFCWSETGTWSSLHEEECSVMVSPGLIEAFEMSAAHFQSDSTREDRLATRDPNAPRPLVALELTPLVPLRRGTALDISIRSPPTSDSLLKCGNNIMFRSRTAQECELLYGLINQARINNAQYIALQSARPGAGFGGAGWAERMDRQRGPSSWLKLGRKGSSYRSGANTRRIASASHSIAPSESSVASMSSAILALKRFSAGNKMFNVAKSTITPRTGGRSGSSSAQMSSSSGGQSGELDSGSSTPLPMVLRNPGEAPMGITNAKVRLYYRESAGKWRDMGSSRLSIMQPPRESGMGPALNRDGSLKQEKRIVVLSKAKNETLLDVTLTEESFERVARTGIAVNMVEQHMGENGEVGVVKKTGGVLVNRQRVYMLQVRDSDLVDIRPSSPLTDDTDAIRGGGSVYIFTGWQAATLESSFSTAWQDFCTMVAFVWCFWVDMDMYSVWHIRWAEKGSNPS